MNMDIAKVKATIRHLLNLANDEAAAEGEIANAMRFATRLMEQHQLRDEDISEVDEKLLDLERAEMGWQSQHTGSSRMSEWEGDAAMFTCRLVGGVQCYAESPSIVRVNGILKLDDEGKPLRRAGICFYGIAEDVEIARQVFAELIVTIASMARLKWGGVYRGDGREYCEGFVSGLNSQLSDSRNQARIAANSDSRALVAIQSRSEIVARKKDLGTKWLRNECGVHLRSAGRGYGGSTHYNASARADGRADGARHQPNAERRRKLTAG
jgi:hypothetical protein